MGGGGGNGNRPHGTRAAHTVYVAAKENGAKDVSAKPTQIRTGISDGVFTEVTDGLKEGDEVITGQTLTSAAAAAANQSSNPFGGGRRF